MRQLMEFKAFHAALEVSAGRNVPVFVASRIFRDAANEGLLTHFKTSTLTATPDVCARFGVEDPETLTVMWAPGDGAFMDFVVRAIEWLSDPENQKKIRSIALFFLSLITLL